MEQGLAELRKIFIKKVDEVIEKAKSTNEIEASLPSVRVALLYIACYLYDCKFYIKVKQFPVSTNKEWL